MTRAIEGLKEALNYTQNYTQTIFDLTKDRESVFPHLVPESYVEQMEFPSKPFYKTGLVVAYVQDLQFTVRIINQKELNASGLSIDELDNIAMENLRKLYPKEGMRGSFKENTFNMLKTGDGHTATILLLMQEYLNPNEELVAAVPDVDTLVVTTLSADFDWNAFRKVAETPESKPLLNKPLKISKTNVEIIELGNYSGL